MRKHLNNLLIVLISIFSECNRTFELRFYIPLNAKQVILETIFPANLLDNTEETKLNTTEANIRPEHKNTITQKYKKLKPGLVASYNLQPRNVAGTIPPPNGPHVGNFTIPQ